MSITSAMADPLATALSAAIGRTTNARDQEMLKSFLRQHEQGRQLSSKQMYWAKTLIERTGGSLNTEFDKKTTTIEEDIFAEPAAVSKMEEAIAEVSATDPLKIAAETNAEALEGLIAKVLEPRAQRIETTLDELSQKRQEAFNKNAAKAIAEQCVVEAMRRLDARVPRKIVVEIKKTDGSTIQLDGHQHEKLPILLQCVAANVPTLQVGPAGSGKSTAGEQVAKALGLDFYLQGAASGTHEYLGYMDAGGQYHTTAWRQSFQHGGLMMCEELDSGSPDIPLIINAGVANGYMTFPDSPKPIYRHKDFRLIGNMNTWGRGADRMYVGRTQLDAATTDRCAFIEWDYDEILEAKIACNVTWTKKVQGIRRAVFEEKARVLVSPRASILGGILLSSGLPEPLVADMVIWKGIDSELRRKIEQRAQTERTS